MSSRKLVFMMGLFLIVAALIAACGPGGGGSGGGGTNSTTINVEGHEFGYTPNSITVKPGESVTINFKNTGTVEHTFVIPQVNFKLTAQPSQTAKGTFTAPTTPGSYEIHCDIAGHKEANMIATLVVVAQ